MALLFIDSFDHYATADIERKWTSSSAVNIIAGGRFGNCLQCGASNAAGSVTLSLDADEDVLIFGGAVRFGTVGATSDTPRVMDFREGGSVQIQVRQTADNTGRLELYRGDGSTLLDTSDNNTFTSDVWYYLEVKVLFDGTSGTVSVRLNGAEIMSFSGDTTATANAYANQVVLLGYRTQAGAIEWDDVYICNNAGGVNDDFLGDVRVEALFPNGNGNSSQFDGSDGDSVDNYLLVDETTAGPDDDTTYVESVTVDNKDTYAYTNLTPTSGSVFGVQIIPYARKTDAGSRSIKTVARHSGSEVDSSASQLSVTYTYYADIRETKPGGGSWSISDVNGAEFGQKVGA